MAKNNLLVLILLTAFAFTGCMTVTYQSPEAQNLKAKPDFEDYVPASFWGFVGEAYPVDTKKVCQNQEPLKVRKGKTTEDWLLTVFTLGIYWPRTVQVWWR